MGLLNTLQELYRTFVGPKWTPTEPANLYNVHKEFLTFEQFKMVMTNLPDYVSESQAEEIFRIADRDGNGYISYTEFKASGFTGCFYHVCRALNILILSFGMFLANSISLLCVVFCPLKRE